MDTISYFKAYLQDKKMFFTRERREIVEAIENIHEHFDVDRLIGIIGNRGFSMAPSTIYRNLRLLCAAGLIETEPDPGGKLFFRRIDRHRPRFQIYCRDCSRGTEIDDPLLQRSIMEFCERLGFNTAGLTVRIEADKKCRNCNGSCRDRRQPSTAIVAARPVTSETL